MQLKFSHNTQELADLHVFNVWSAPWKKASRQKIGFLIPLAFALFATAFLIDGASVVLGIALLVLAGLWLIFYDKVYTYRLNRFAKGHYNHEVNERFWADHSYNFKEEHILIQNKYVETKLQWNAIINVIERDDAFWLFETLTAAHIVPKRVLQGKEMEFKQLLARKLVKK